MINQKTLSNEEHFDLRNRRDNNI